MNFNDYQQASKKTATYPNVGNNFIYPTLGLAGEAGEVANKIKKVQRDDLGAFNEDSRLAVQHELGDVLWYVAQLATELGLSLEDIAAANIEKLKSRQERGVLGGAGDER